MRGKATHAMEKIADLLEKNGPATKQQLTDMLGMKFSCVNSAVWYLEQGGFIEWSGEVIDVGGPNGAKLWAFARKFDKTEVKSGKRTAFPKSNFAFDALTSVWMK